MNCVSINLKTNEIVIKIDDNASQEEIVFALTKKIRELKKLYKDEKIPIHVVGKILKNSELEEIKELIKSQIDVEIIFDSPTTLGLSSIKKSYKKDIGISET